MEKNCFCCSRLLPLDEFYRHPKMADGRLGKCKQCVKNAVTKRRNENIEKIREYDRKRANLPHRVQKRKEVADRWKTEPELKKRAYKLRKKWQEKNEIKRAAHVLTRNAIKCGKLFKQPCEVCGKKKVEAHHDDYTKPLDVRWLCTKHHAEHHRNLRQIEREKRMT